MKTGKSILWVTDPWETLDHANDTSLRLMQESLKLRIPTFWCDVGTIRLEDGRVQLTARKLLRVSDPRGGSDFEFGPEQTHSPTRFTALHYRTDPPVDLHYLHPLQLLHLSTRKTRSKVVNPPEVLLSMSEKMSYGFPKRWLPATLLSSEKERLVAFGRKHGKTVAKPPHQAQSKGVEKLDWTTPENEERSLRILDSLTLGFTQLVVLQEFLEKVYEGEKRFWFVNGKLLATVVKRPLTGDFRVQIDRGSEIQNTQLTAPERKLAQEIAAYLRKLGIQLAAVDAIGAKITDLNFTSPGLIVQMEKITGRNLAAEVLRLLK